MLMLLLQLFIKGLAPASSTEDVTGLFSDYGTVKDVKFDHSCPGRAWIVSCLMSG